MGSRNRKLFTSDTHFQIYRIRRLQCQICGKIHHELPDIFIPYKRFSASVMTLLIEDPNQSELEVSTTRRLLHWFNGHLDEFIASTLTTRHKVIKQVVVKPPDLTFSKLDRLKCLYDHHPRWLSHLVQTLANFNLWVQTRSVLCPT